MLARILFGAVLGTLVALPVAGNAADYVMRLGHAQSTKDVFHLGAVEFKKALEAKTDGRVQVDIFPSSQLGKIRDMIEGLRVGTIQVVVEAPSRLSVYDKRGDVFKLPYLVETYEQNEKMWTSEYGRKLLKELGEASGIEVIGVSWRGARHITSNREIHTPEDMAGLKIRVPPYDLPVAIFKTLGASPTPMDFNEVYLALQQGIIDAQENPTVPNWTNRMQEVCKYVILTGHIKDVSGLMMGKDYLDSLPEDIQQAVHESGVVAARVMSKFIVEEEAAFLQKFKDAGVTVIEPDVAAFRAKFEGFIAKYDPNLGEFAAKIKSLK